MSNWSERREGPAVLPFARKRPVDDGLAVFVCAGCGVIRLHMKPGQTPPVGLVVCGQCGNDTWKPTA